MVEANMAGEAGIQLQSTTLDEVDTENDPANFALDRMKLPPPNSDELNDDMDRDNENLMITPKNKCPATATCLQHSNEIKFGVGQILKSYKQENLGKLFILLF